MPHFFLLQQDDVAKKMVDAVIAADKKDGLGYMEASPFEVGVRGGWRKAGPPHRQRMLRLSATNTGEPSFVFTRRSMCSLEGMFFYVQLLVSS